MIRNMQYASLYAVIIAAHKIIIAVVCHVGGGNGNILVPRNIDPLAIIMLVIHAGGNGEPGNRTLAVIHHRVYIRRKNGLRVVVNGYAGFAHHRKVCGSGVRL